MSRTVLLGVVFAFLLAVVGILVYLNFFTTPGPAARPPEGPAAESPAPVPEGSSPPSSLSTATASPSAAPTPGETTGEERNVLLYFQGMDVGLLFPEERETDLPVDGNGQARRIIEELTRGPTRDPLPTIPSGTQLREVYFDTAGTAYLDFSSELRDNHPGGTAEELMTVESIVNTLTRNVPQVSAVYFLIEGRPVDTLAGHVDLSVPLRPSSERLALTP